ncbi:riboflavin synthase [Verticiella sediminum]|uniref:Riboflavin synthase n=1 Tax=Verticiella sediminum TaxID=1247510 RepID=A0A556AQ97_9BURK|nr:riboflavin synthase [Verticiella sediminum]TSH95060.1 riboflavin synthase [Verticiella sediminum]
MFTGIVAAIGRIVRVESQDAGEYAGLRLFVDSADLGLADVKEGDSIALQGACMTVTGMEGKVFSVDISHESLRLTVGLDAPGEVNLEKALRMGDALGGHILSGHVDGIAEVVRFAPVGESHELVVRVPAAFGRYLAYKGSIAINGVSLTVNRVADGPEGSDASINLIPHTIAMTTLKHLQPGSKVNFEVDMIARYVQRMLQDMKTG